MANQIIRTFIDDNGETIPILASDLGDGTYALGITSSGTSSTGMTNPMTTVNDIIVAGVDGDPERLPVGNTGEVLTVVSGVGPQWSAPTGGMVNPMTAEFDLIVGGAGGSPQALPMISTFPPRAGKYILFSDSLTVPAWTTATGAGLMVNVMNAEGDIIYATDGTGEPTNLPIGTEGQVLTVYSGINGVIPYWADASGGFTNPMTTQGDLMTMNATPAADRLAIGATAGMVLESNGFTPGWIQKWSQAIFTFEGTLVSGASNSFRLYNLEGVNRTITRVAASVSTAPTGANIIVDVHKNGTTIFTTPSNRPTIAISGFTTTQDTLEVNSWNVDEYLTAHLDQVGTTVAGADLALYVYYIPTPHTDGGGPM